MRRRDFITLLGDAAAWPIAARAQPDARVHWIGALMLRPDDDQFSREADPSPEWVIRL